MNSDDAQVGVTILRKALEVPLGKISENIGMNRSVILQDVHRQPKSKKNPNIGIFVISVEYVDLVKDSVIDPAKVTRGALENAASIAAMILTTEALITDVPEKETAPPMPNTKNKIDFYSNPGETMLSSTRPASPFED